MQEAGVELRNRISVLAKQHWIWMFLVKS